MKTPHVIPKLGAVLVLIAGALAILAYFWDTAGGDLPFQSTPYEVTATLTDSQQLSQNADVRAAGVKIGSVDSVKNVGERIEVVLHIKKEHAPIHEDAEILVRQKTLVGENYIEVNPGSAKAGAVPDGGRITVKAQKEAVPIDRVLSSLDAETRDRISRNLQATGKGVKGRASDLNELFNRVPDLSTSGMKLMEVLDDRRAQVASIVQNTGVLMNAVGSRNADIQRLIGSVKATSEAVASRDQALKSALDTIPGTFRQTRGTVDRLTAFAGTATPVVDDARVALTTLRPVLDQLVPTARQARRLVASLPALAKTADPALVELKEFAEQSRPIAKTADGFLAEANPFLTYAKPYHRDVVGLLSKMGTGAWLDRFGAIGGCLCPVGDRTFSGWTPELRALVAPLLDQGIVPQVLDQKKNHYREPNRQPDFEYAQDDSKYKRIEAAPRVLGGGD
ncbi:MAG: MCE family protein [Solirubrobacteraceae bacterium]|nr:MCE family protein [Solirubrobacteraceae bacterium]